MAWQPGERDKSGSIVVISLKNLSFKMQMYISLAILVCFFALGQFLKMGIFHNIAWIVIGLLFFINPVWPKSVDRKNHAELKKGVRIGSVLVIIVFGFLIRYVV